MGLTQTRTSAVANAAADAVTALADGGFLRIFDGAQPFNADTALSGQTLIAELQLGTPAFVAAVDGVALSEAITDEDAALATGTVTWFRIYASDGTTSLWDGSVGVGEANLNFDDTQITVDDIVTVVSLVFSESVSLDSLFAFTEFTGDGTSTVFNVGEAFTPGTLKVWVDGLLTQPASQIPATGQFTLDAPAADGANLYAEYERDV